MTLQEIENEIIDYLIAKIGGDFSCSSRLNEILDSLQIIDTVVFCEEHFGFEFEVDDLKYENFNSVRSLSECVFRKLV